MRNTCRRLLLLFVQFSLNPISCMPLQCSSLLVVVRIIIQHPDKNTFLLEEMHNFSCETQTFISFDYQKEKWPRIFAWSSTITRDFVCRFVILQLLLEIFQLSFCIAGSYLHSSKWKINETYEDRASYTADQVKMCKQQQMRKTGVYISACERPDVYDARYIVLVLCL